ncbi:hypothetical protein MC885_006858, partial [Smutsia gigantea]
PCAATNPDRRSDGPRAFWGRTDSPRALLKAGPATGEGGTAPGAARGIQAGSRALPVSGGGGWCAGGPLGGRRSERRAVEAERERAHKPPQRQVPAPAGSPRRARGPARLTGAARSRRWDPRRASRAARKQQPPRARDKLRLPGPGRREKSSRGEPCAGCRAGAMERRSPGGPVEGEDSGGLRCCAPRFRFALPGRWV